MLTPTFSTEYLTLFEPFLEKDLFAIDVETTEARRGYPRTSRTQFEIDGHPPSTRSKQPPSRAPYGVKVILEERPMGRSLHFTP